MHFTVIMTAIALVFCVLIVLCRVINTLTDFCVDARAFLKSLTKPEHKYSEELSLCVPPSKKKK